MELNLKILDDKDLPSHKDEGFDLFDPTTFPPDEGDDDGDGDYVADGDAAARVVPAPSPALAPSVGAGGPSSGPVPPLRFRGTTLPVRFRGSVPTGLAHTPPDRDIRGTVSMTQDGHVHWVSSSPPPPPPPRPPKPEDRTGG